VRLPAQAAIKIILLCQALQAEGIRK